MNNDLISREALKEDFKTRLEKAKRWKENAINRGDDEIVIRATATIDFICEVIMTIDRAPTVGDHKPSKWIFERIDPQKGGNIHSCDKCGQEVHTYSTDYQNRPCAFKYCPRCGSLNQQEASK